MQPGSPLSYLIPIGVAVLVIVLRNSRARRLKIERLWVYPAILLVLLVGSLIAAPPPVTPIGVGLLVAGFALGALIGWQRGRLTRLHIHPETHELSSRASPLGLIFIFAILALRYGLRGAMAEESQTLGLPVFAIGEALLVMAAAMMSAQRLELWRRAARMLAEAKPGALAAGRPS